MSLTVDQPAARRGLFALPAVSEAQRRLSCAGRSDRDGMEEVYRLTHVKLFAVCQAIARDRSAAEEVLQDVYLNVWSSAWRFGNARGSAMTWLITLARNRAVGHHRHTSHFQFDEPVVLDRVVDP